VGKLIPGAIFMRLFSKLMLMCLWMLCTVHFDVNAESDADDQTSTAETLEAGHYYEERA
jgi:hypothetical protein